MKIIEYLKIDIMVGNRFFGQVRYPVPEKKKEDDADYDARKIERFILKAYPSLRRKHYRIEFSN
jgi:hypothetical protein